MDPIANQFEMDPIPNQFKMDPSRFTSISKYREKKDKYLAKKVQEEEAALGSGDVYVPDQVIGISLQETSEACFSRNSLDEEYRVQLKFVADLARSVGFEDKQFTTEPQSCGSSYEGVKIKGPDEFDHFLELQNCEELSADCLEFEEYPVPTSKPTKHPEIKRRSYFRLKLKDKTITDKAALVSGNDSQSNTDWPAPVSGNDSQASVPFNVPSCPYIDDLRDIITKHKESFNICQFCVKAGNMNNKCFHQHWLHPDDLLYSYIYENILREWRTFMRCKKCTNNAECNHRQTKQSLSHAAVQNKIDELFEKEQENGWRNLPDIPNFDGDCVIPSPKTVLEKMYEFTKIQKNRRYMHTERWNPTQELKAIDKWRSFLRCKNCLGNPECPHGGRYICPRAVQDQFFELVTKVANPTAGDTDDPSMAYITRNGPAVTVHRPSERTKYGIVSTDLVLAIPMVNSGDKQWPLAGMVDLDLNESTLCMLSRKQVERCHFLPYGDYWKLSFVYHERDITKTIMENPLCKISYLTLKSMKEVTSDAGPFESSLLPSYLIKVPFLREILENATKVDRNIDATLSQELDRFFNGECKPESFRRLCCNDKVKKSIRLAIDVVNKVDREGIEGKLLSLFIKDDLLKQPDDKAFLAIRRIKQHLLDHCEEGAQPVDTRPSTRPPIIQYLRKRRCCTITVTLLLMLDLVVLLVLWQLNVLP